MPSIPSTPTLNGTSVEILNAIRNNASANYRDYVPLADASMESVRQIGNILMNYPALQNEFVSALVNRIGRVIITSKSYNNPWAMFKKGMLEFGETIEEVFVNIAKPFQYNVTESESKVFKREIPDVRAAFHVMNYQEFYKSTIQQEQLRQAFLTWNGVTDFIAKIVDAMYTAANQDEFLVMKYMLALNILRGRLTPVTVTAVTDAASAKTFVTNVKALSNKMEFMSTKYNVAGVYNHTEKDSQYLIINSDVEAAVGVDVLAVSFNMEKAEFMGHRVLVDGFGELDVDRLDKLFYGQSEYHQFTSDELTALNAIPAVLVDKDFFMIFDNMLKFTEQYNGEGLYWNYWYHVWKIFSVSPYANSAVFVPGTPNVTGVTITPSTASVMAGQTLSLSAAVTSAYYAPQTVAWSLSANAPATIDNYGVLVIDEDATAGTEITVTATSTFKPSVYGTATVTVVDPTANAGGGGEGGGGGT